MTLSASSAPFQCYLCCHTDHTKSVESLTATVSQLQQQVVELKKVVEDLKSSGTQQLAETLEAHHGDTGSGATQATQTEYEPGMRGQVGGRGRGRRRGRGGRGGRLVSGRNDFHGSRSFAERLPDSQGGYRPSELRHKVKVEGARRVWGTLSVCSASTVKNVIRKMCANDTVQARRKTKELRNGRVCWWFVLHDDEVCLQDIDAKWEHVKLQTSWKLEPCFYLSTEPSSSTGGDGISAPETLSATGEIPPSVSPTPALQSKTSSLSQTQALTSPQTQALTSLQPQTPQNTSDAPAAQNVSDQGNPSFLANSSNPQQQLEEN